MLVRAGHCSHLGFVLFPQVRALSAVCAGRPWIPLDRSEVWRKRGAGRLPALGVSRADLQVLPNLPLSAMLKWK